MNPWTLYEHKPQLVEALVVGAVAVTTLRRCGLRGGATSLAAASAAAWSAVGLLDFLVYAFGYQIAGLSIPDSESVQVVLEWLRVPIVAAAAVAFTRNARSP